jgi:hypothetical protein
MIRTRISSLCNGIRHVVAEHGRDDALADALCNFADDFVDEAVNDIARERLDISGPRPRQSNTRLGLTETEASLRACPLARVVIADDRKPRDQAVGSRYQDPNGSDYTNPAACRCIGAMCLGWR